MGIGSVLGRTRMATVTNFPNYRGARINSVVPTETMMSVRRRDGRGIHMGAHGVGDEPEWATSGDGSSAVVGGGGATRPFVLLGDR